MPIAVLSLSDYCNSYRTTIAMICNSYRDQSCLEHGIRVTVSCWKTLVNSRTIKMCVCVSLWAQSLGASLTIPESRVLVYTCLLASGSSPVLFWLNSGMPPAKLRHRTPDWTSCSDSQFWSWLKYHASWQLLYLLLRTVLFLSRVPFLDHLRAFRKSRFCLLSPLYRAFRRKLSILSWNSLSPERSLQTRCLGFELQRLSFPLLGLLLPPNYLTSW